jgi:hypothetical protein
MPVSLNGTSGLTFNDASTQNTAATGFGFKNRILNGQMVIDQRNAGASQTINNTTAYTVDRWYVGFVGGSGTSQRVAGTGGFQNAIRMTGGSGITSAFVGQKIESFNSADLAGNTVTVSFRASSSTLTSIAWYARFPTAVDNYASVTAISNATINITSTPTNYTFSFACPSGVTNGLEIFFLTGSFTSGTLDITGVQLEKGSTATSFDYRPYGTELALCQRYCYVSIGANSLVAGAAQGVDNVYMKYILPVPMRATPSLTFTASVGQPLTISDQYINDWGASSPTVMQVPTNGEISNRVRIGGFTGLTTGRWYGGSPNTTGSITYSAEL